MDKVDKTQKILQIRAIWSDNNTKLGINIQKQNVSDPEALGILEMAKQQILNIVKQNENAFVAGEK